MRSFVLIDNRQGHRCDRGIPGGPASNTQTPPPSITTRPIQTIQKIAANSIAIRHMNMRHTLAAGATILRMTDAWDVWTVGPKNESCWHECTTTMGEARVTATSCGWFLAPVLQWHSYRS